MKTEFSFFMPVKIIMENDAIDKLTPYIKGSRILVVCDPFLHENHTAMRVEKALSGKKVVYFTGVEPNPSCESVDLAADIARRHEVDCVIGLGGGSAMDIAKITACLAKEDGSIYDYYSGGAKKLSARTTELVLIPTTAGTGSEVTNVGVYTNKKTGIKMPFVTDEFWADTAILDKSLTYTLPAPVTAATGMDAFCHAIEAYWNINSQPICDFLSVGALKLVLDNVKTAVFEPNNKEARANMLLASLVAGISFSQTRTTGIHAVSFPLTSEFGASHGKACALTLPAFIRVSGEKAAEKMQSLCDKLGFADITALADHIEQLMREIGLPTRLSEIGVTEADLPHIADVGLSAGIIQLTPATMNGETLMRLLKSIL